MSSPAPEQSVGMAAVRAWCGWHIAPPTRATFKVEGEGSSTLLLPSLHLTDVLAVRDESGALVTGYKWRPNGVIRGWWRREELYTFDVMHGFEQIPRELAEVAGTLTDRGVGSPALASQAAGPFSQSFATGDLESQPITVRSIVGRYALPARP